MKSLSVYPALAAFALVLGFEGPCTVARPLSSKSAHVSRGSAFNASVPRWEWSPLAGPLANGDSGMYLNLSSGVDLWYASFGDKASNKTPVLLLHGGQGNSNQMFHQANYLSQDRQVIVQDTRGEGRSPYANFTEFHYDDFARDAIAVLDHLNVSKVAVIGWSDGAITGLNLAMNYSSRIDRVFAHGANNNANMSIPGLNDPIINSDTGSFDADFSTNGTTYSTRPDSAFAGLRKRQSDASCSENPDQYAYCKISPTPDKEQAMLDGVANMWNTEPTWAPEAFAKIRSPVWIVDGDHDTAIERNQADAMAAWTPYAGQLLLPQVGHEALLQDPAFFNFAAKYFCDMTFDGPRPVY